MKFLLVLFLFVVFLEQQPLAQDSLKTLRVSIGYRTKRVFWKQDKTARKITGVEKKSMGGLRGGQVEMHFENYVYGFEDIHDVKVPHLFPYFALFGRRCASSCYEMFMQVGILKKSKLSLILGVSHPRKFRKIMRKVS